MTNHPAAGPRGASMQRFVLIAFTMAIFTSAFLLFAIQPMFTKMVLPQLGGSPAVWSVAMVFFQALLLAGYLYAHLLARHLPFTLAVLLHLILLAGTLLVLPIAVSPALGSPPPEGQALWLIGVFLLSVGLPFFAVAGNGPLLQAWFARSGHAQAHDPYFLYGASNLGSFAALLLYPVLFEPLLSVKMQSYGWSAGFAVLIALIALSAGLIRSAPAQARAGEPRAHTSAPGGTTILAWIGLSFIPSGLLVAVTAHISTDVAAAPFLWVIPLALFLLTFVLLFRDRPLVPMGAIARILPILAGGLVLFSYFGAHMFVVVVIVHLAFFMAAALNCHHRLYALRPSAAHLTSFYLWMSFGGVLGGLFSGLLAPMIFNRILEYPILIVASMLALKGVYPAPRRTVLRQAVPVLVIGLVYWALLRINHDVVGSEPGPTFHIIFLIATAGTMLAYRFPLIVTALLPMLFLGLDTMQQMQGGRVSMRSFFGVHKLESAEAGQFRILSHGTTIHGAMRIKNADGSPVTGRPKPLTYYHPDAPIAETLRAVPEAAAGRDLAVVGLGAGAHVCNGGAADRWTYFEIDASVERIARDPKLFRFLSDCAPQTRIVIGDARLTLNAQAAARYDYLLIDAFSSDSIPVHLMTREALALYANRLKEGGLLVFHISNRHLELESVVAALARDAGFTALINADSVVAGSLENKVSSIVVALARKGESLSALASQPGWQPITDRGVSVWSDDFSNILGALWRRYWG